MIWSLRPTKLSKDCLELKKSSKTASRLLINPPVEADSGAIFTYLWPNEAENRGKNKRSKLANPYRSQLKCAKNSYFRHNPAAVFKFFFFRLWDILEKLTVFAWIDGNIFYWEQNHVVRVILKNNIENKLKNKFSKMNFKEN